MIKQALNERQFQIKRQNEFHSKRQNVRYPWLKIWTESIKRKKSLL